jgi:predicted Zn-ribbon and HTH transcriptional regulator
MKNKPRLPTIPAEKQVTIRRGIISLLQEEPLTAREISARVGIPEKEVLDHLEHIRAAARDGGEKLRLIPAACRKCGFEFHKRERLARPGRCPVCHGEQIREPRYFME